MLQRILLIALAGAVFPAALPAATIIGPLTPIIYAGDPNGTPTDSPAARVDPNTADSPFGGVVAMLNSQGGFSGSGVAVSPTHILTAAHLGIGAGSQVRINIPSGNQTSEIRTVALVAAQPDAGSLPFPFDDLVIVTLTAPLPAGTPIYPLYRQPVQSGDIAVLVGYGASGDGVTGTQVGGSGTVKRLGFNVIDAFSSSLSGNNLVVVGSNPSGTERTYLFDFDGPTQATNAIGGGTLGNDVETVTGGGDSGSPMFVVQDGILRVAGINGFIFNTTIANHPLFGSGGGGQLVYPYLSWIDSIVPPLIIPAPEPGLLFAWTLPALVLLFWRRRRRG